MTKERIPLQWQVGWTDDSKSTPGRFVPAQVPGAVQLDWGRAERWGSHEYADNYLKYDSLRDKHWLYRAQIPQFKPGENQRVYFVCRGIDYRYEVRINGELRLAQEGMHTPFELDVTKDGRQDP